MARDVAQRELDQAGFRIANVGTPAAPGDATKTDNTTVPQPSAGAGSPGVSLLAAPADHVHPAPPSAPGLIQLGSDGEQEVTGPTEEVIFQAFVDFGPITSPTFRPVLSGLISVDSEDATNFILHLGGTPGAADGDVIADITTQSATPVPQIATGGVIPTPTAPTMVKVTGRTNGATATARITSLRVAMG